MSIRNIRSNYLADKVTYTSSTTPIGTVIPVFKANDDKVIDDGVVVAIAQYSINSGSGYTTDIMTPAGFATEPVEIAVNPATTFSVSNDTITYPAISSILSTGDKVIVKSTAQAPNKAALGGSIASFTITNGGSGYVGTPTVQVGDNGSGPTSAGNFQVATSGGAVTGINVIEGGTGYQFPTVTISGGGGSNATATATLASNGTGGVLIDEGQEYIVDVTGANTFRLARSAGDISSGYFFNITNLGSSGSIVLVTSQGFGLRVGVAAQGTGAIDYTTIKQAGYGYAPGDTMKILQPGSNGDGKIRIQTVSSDTADNPMDQYPGFLYCDGSTYGAADYPLLYEVIKDNYGGTGGSYEKKDFGSTSTITFQVPDYKTRKLVGAGGGVSGGGSPVSGTVISAVGATGGKWYFSKSEQESLIDIGNVVISGYDNVTEFVSASLTGEVTMTVGPLQEKMIAAPPEHEHAIMTSNAPQAGAMSGAGYFMDNHSAGYKNGTGGVSFFQPAGGVPLFHTHGIVDYIITDPLASTYGNVAGVGTKITKTFTESAFNTTDDTITITGHGMVTGHKLRVQSNPATNPAVFTYAPGNPPAGATINATFSPNTNWYVVKVDDNTVKIATSKWNALRNNTVDITTNGDAATIIVEVAYNAAGNFPSEPTTTITTPAPTVYDIDNNYVIGGKTITIPGTEFGDTEWFSEQNVGGSYTIPASTSSQEPVEYIVGRMTGSGGLGASTNIPGVDGLDSYYQVTLNGYQYKLIAGGGKGGNDFDELLQTRDWVVIGSGQISGGAAAVWSSFLLANGIYITAPSGTSTDPYLEQWVEGGVGINVDAGLAAAGFNVEFHADGLSEMDLYNPDGSWKQGNATPPNATSGSPQTSSQTLVVPANTLIVGWNNLKFRIKNVSSTQNDWDNNPCAIGFVATRNDTGATMFDSRNECTNGTTEKWNLSTGGAGGAGGTAKVEVYSGGSLVQTQNISVSDIGNAISLTGGLSINVNNYIEGNAGTAGGAGSTGGIGGATIFVHGTGGDGSRTLFTGSQNAISEWATNTGGTSISYTIPSNYPVSQVTAELKGGGGAAGDGTQLSSMNGQPNANNDSFQLVAGCFAGSGGLGNNSVCTGGGGGGGGGGVGSGAGIGGGGGAGNGSNAVKPGFGAGRGQSSLVSGQSIISEGDANNGGDVNIGEQIDGTDGYVKITTNQNTTEYGPGGGGGGSGCHFDFMLDNLSGSSVPSGTMYIGNGNQDGDGRIGYGVLTSSNPTTGTSQTVGLFDRSSDGCDYVDSGTGSGSNGGFVSPDTQKYLRFRGTPQERWARTITYNASGSNTAGTVTESVRFEVIRGNDSNGGETPTAPLELFGSNDGGGSYVKFGTISTSGGATTWENVDVAVPTTYRVSNLIMEVRQSRSASGNENLDNYGIAKVSMIHAEGEVTTYTTQSGRLDLGIESIQEVIAPQGDPVNSAGITVNDGKFTLSSAVKLNVTPSLQPEVDIPLVTRYHLVKYMIRAY